MKPFLLLLALLVKLSPLLLAQPSLRIDSSIIYADSLNEKITKLMEIANISGVAVSVFNNNSALFSKTFGFANMPQKLPLQPNTVLYGASFSKTVFAYIAMLYVQEKLIDLDKPLWEYLSKPLPEYSIKGWNRGYQDLKNDARYKLITARMCLTHTTGFPNWRWFEADKKIKFKFQPGTRYSYSGEGFYLLQFVIEQLTNKDFETIAQERVFKPLGMLHTSYVWQKRFENNYSNGYNAKGEPYSLMKWKEASAAGSLSTTLEDFTKFYTAFISGQGLLTESFEAMTQLQVSIKSKSQFGPLAVKDSTQNDNIQLGYGLGVGVFNSPYGRAFFKEGHDEGWGHYSICFPDKKIAIIIMTNNDNGESIFKELLEYAIGDTFTPWRWENYLPYDQKN